MKNPNELLRIKRLIAETYLQNEKHLTADVWNKVNAEVYEKLAFLRKTMNDKLDETYAKMTPSEKLAVVDRILEEALAKTTALQTLYADFLEELRKAKFPS